MPTVVIHSTAGCPYCLLARWLLRRRGVPFEERRMRRSQRGRLAALGGGMTFPQIEIGDRVVDGFSELRRLDRSGELARLVAPAHRPHPIG